MSFDDFFSTGLRDIERRLPIFRPVTQEDRREVFSVVESSAVFRATDRIVSSLARTPESSVVVGLVRDAWSALHPGQKRLALGLALLVASLVHAGLVLWHEAPPTWLWLIAPGLAVSAGLLLVVFASMERQEHG